MKQFVINILRGIAIGGANIIPGLSGATLALLLGIYQKTIGVVTKFDAQLIFLIKEFEFKKIKNHISLNFITAIGLGVLIGFISISKLLTFLDQFKDGETYTWAYFFGLIFASVFYIIKHVDKWTIKENLCFMIGLLISVSILFLEPQLDNQNLFFVFICGIIGVVGMLIPGLSGSYLLKLLGNFDLLLKDTITHITDTSIIHEENYLYVKLFSTFLLGSIIGVLIFSRIIKWLLRKFQNITFSILSGFVLGSLTYIWPWQHNKEGVKLIENLYYPNFEQNIDIYIIIIMATGISTVIVIEKIVKKYKDV